MPYQVTHHDDMFSVCRVSTIGGSVWSIPEPASKDSERSSRSRLMYALPGYTP